MWWDRFAMAVALLCAIAGGDFAAAGNGYGALVCGLIGGIVIYERVDAWLSTKQEG